MIKQRPYEAGKRDSQVEESAIISCETGCES